MSVADQKIMALIDKYGAPESMSLREWIDFLESIISECRSRVDAAKEDLRDGK